jgi:hypothetical protein
MVQEQNLNGDYRNRNANHVGSYRSGGNFPGRRVCGIYEWKVKREEEEIVVYVGSSCNDGNSPLKDRILQYCRNGSHKIDLINYTLSKGYDLYVRWGEFSGVGESMEAENFLLHRYNYAWNVRDYGIRATLVGVLHM